MIYDAAVIIPTLLRPQLARAVRSAYAQDLDGTIQVVVGIDEAEGERALLDELRAECPPHMNLTVIDLGYSTSSKRGGFYPVWAAGSLRTVMSYAANSRYLAYLDDDNWWAPGHVSDLLAAIQGHAYAYSLRWYVHPETMEIMCVDRWESVGPGRGVYRQKFNGFIDTNCLMIDKRRCHWILPAWCIPANSKGAGPDRTMYRYLQRDFEGAATGNATAYYVIRPTDVDYVRNFMNRTQERAGAE